MTTILSVAYVADYTLLIHFEGIGPIAVDLYNYLKTSRQPMTRQFLDIKRFRQFQLLPPDHITWDWEMDLDAGWLYEYAMQQQAAEKKKLAV